jgi:hypothetical protein
VSCNTTLYHDLKNFTPDCFSKLLEFFYSSLIVISEGITTSNGFVYSSDIYAQVFLHHLANYSMISAYQSSMDPDSGF